MQAAQPFGRRGVAVAVPASTPMQQARARPLAEPKPRSDSTTAWVLRMLFSFDGRLQRSDYRLFRTGWYIVWLGVFYGLKALLAQATANPALLTVLLPLSLAAPVLVIWTTLAMQVKRWHDRGKSWPWMFIGFIPIAGPIWVFVELCWIEGDQGPNAFGPSPRGDPEAVFA